MILNIVECLSLSSVAPFFAGCGLIDATIDFRLTVANSLLLGVCVAWDSFRRRN
jgi:hypothetical protein